MTIYHKKIATTVALSPSVCLILPPSVPSTKLSLHLSILSPFPSCPFSCCCYCCSRNPRDIINAVYCSWNLHVIKNTMLLLFSLFFQIFFFFLSFRFVRLRRFRSWRINLYVNGTANAETSRLPPESSSLSSRCSSRCSVSRFRYYYLPSRACTHGRDGRRRRGWRRKSWRLLAAYLTRVTGDLLRRLYHALRGTVQAALTTLHEVWNKQRGKRVFT